ncbi:MAG: hypothetical protein KF716_15815 [Anaerolineae bacterium]|nr:hypothetical protein [Anaerolineae bacterium]
MSNAPVQPADSSAPNLAASNSDKTLRARQWLVVVLSFAIGAVITAIFMIAFLKVGLDVTFPMSNWEFPLIVAATIPMGFLVMIWLDYFMGTKILPD